MSAKSYPLLRFSVGVRREPAIEIWLDGKPRELGRLARRWFDRLRACGPDVLELMHDGFPTARRSRIRRACRKARGNTCGM